jgi:acyl-CoA thioesterase-1
VVLKGLFAAAGALIAAAILAAAAVAAEPLRIVALGDSLTAGFELPPDAAFPFQLQRALEAKGIAVVVENAGVSGDTSSAGLDRLDWAVPDGTDGVILELGANDALRGLPPEITERNLDEIVTRLKARGVSVFIAGMRAPPNMGADYVAAFDGIFPRLAQKHGAPLYPFFLEGVAGERSLNLPDGIHPTREGVAVIVERIAPAIAAWLEQLG